ncbi:MAG: DUF998 domain-containing protein [Candidatus Nanopelagicales bacterium]
MCSGRDGEECTGAGIRDGLRPIRRAPFNAHYQPIRSADRNEDLYVTEQLRVKPWALVSATCAPIILIGGWTYAAMLQPPGFDAARDTISALAAIGATDRVVMTGALLLVGACHIITGNGLPEARIIGRVVLAIGGLATIGVALAPLPASGGSTLHGLFAFIAFGCLGAWPLVAWHRSRTTSWALRKRRSITAGVVLILLVAGFAVSLVSGELVGATERLAAAAQGIWPAVVVWFAFRAQRRQGAAIRR